MARLIQSSSAFLPPDSYLYTIVAIDSYIAAISSDDSLNILDPQTLSQISNGDLVHAHSGVTCLKRLDSESRCVVTAGRDGAIFGWDLRSCRPVLELSDST